MHPDVPGLQVTFDFPLPGPGETAARMSSMRDERTTLFCAFALALAACAIESDTPCSYSETSTVALNLVTQLPLGSRCMVYAGSRPEVHS